MISPVRSSTTGNGSAGREQQPRGRPRRRARAPRSGRARRGPTRPISSPSPSGDDRVDRHRRDHVDPVGAQHARAATSRRRRAARRSRPTRMRSPRSSRDGRAGGPRAGRGLGRRHRLVAAPREIEISRLRESNSSATVASTNGAMSRYSEIDRIGVASALTSPTTMPASSVTTSELQARDQRRRQRRDDQERERGRVEPDQVRQQQPRHAGEQRRRPARPAASTRRTGTPSVAVISRSLASAAHRGAELRVAQERQRCRPSTTTPSAKRDDLRPVDEHVADREVLGRGRQDHRARLVAPDPRHRRRAGSAPARASRSP